MNVTFPKIRLMLNSLSDFSDHKFAEKVLNIINSYGKDFEPDVFDDLQPLNKKYNVNNIDEPVNTWINLEANNINKEHGYLAGSLLMKKNRGSKVSYSISWEKTQHARFNGFSLSIDNKFCNNEKKFSQFMRLCYELIMAFNPVQAGISNGMDSSSWKPINLMIRHPELQWINIFGKPYIELFGRNKLMSTPSYKVYELSEELIAVQLTESVFDDITDEIRSNVKLHLGEDSFVYGEKSINSYKDGRIPNFDFSDVLFDSTKPIEELKVLNLNDLK